MSILNSITEKLGITSPKPTPEQISARERRAALARQAAEEARQAALREEEKQRKIRQMKQIAKDARVEQILLDSEFELEIDRLHESVCITLPLGYTCSFRLRPNIKYVELNHRLSVVQRLRDYILRYESYLTSGKMALGVDVKLPKPPTYVRLVYNLPIRHNLVFSFETQELETMQPIMLEAVKEISEIFVTLSERQPSFAAYFALNPKKR